MNLLAYTTHGEIRAALGINDIELPDETLSLAMYSSNLSMELDDLNLALQPRFEIVKAIPDAALSRDQRRFLDAARLFATYTVAKQLCGSLPMFGPKSVGDSKTEVSRFSDSPYKETIKSVKKEWDINRQRVAAALGALELSNATTIERTVFLVSSPSSDPVTG